MDKSSWREILRERLRGISTESRTEQSARACALMLSQSVFRAAHSILLYMPLKGELNVQPLLDASLAAGKQVALPRFIPETQTYGAFLIGGEPLVAGAYGVMEPSSLLPIPLNRLDLIVVPGLGFDVRGRRLGRGKGFYDRLLSEATGVKCGICFEEQLVPEIPAEPHDVAVDYLATPSRWHDCRGLTPELK